MNELIRLERITKKFGDHVIIPSLDLTIHDGEFLTLLGPSGCGKTTLLRMIAGLETPTTGKVILDGQDITKLPPYKRNVNMVFQNYALFPHMTVAENIRFGLKMKKVPTEETEDRINQVLYLTQLEELRNRYPSQMSGGQQQRVAIARALIAKPDVIFADEPTGNLDSKSGGEVMELLQNVWKKMGKALVVITHDSRIARMADRQFQIVDGVLAEVTAK